MTLEEKLNLNIALDDIEIIAIYKSINIEDEFYFHLLLLCIDKIDMAYKEKLLSDNMIILLNDIKENNLITNRDRMLFIDEKINDIFFHNGYKINSESNNCRDKIDIVNKSDNFGLFFNKIISEMDETEVFLWHKIITIFRTVNQNKMSKKFTTEVSDIIKKIGHDKYKDTFIKLIEHIIHMDVTIKNTIEQNNYLEEYIFVDTSNINIVRALIMSSFFIFDFTISSELNKLTQKCYEKNKTTRQPHSKLLGNTCIYLLGECSNIESVFTLYSLFEFIKDGAARKKIKIYINKISVDMKINVHDLEDICVPYFGLTI